MQCKDFVDDRVRSLAMGSQRVRVQISKGHGAHTMFKMLNALQREPQRADLNEI